MKARYSLVLGLVLALGLSTSSFAAFGNLSAYASAKVLGNAASNAGGFRVDLGTIAGQGSVADFSVNFQGSVRSIYADFYVGYFGVSVLSNATNALQNISLMFAVEQAINNKISLGVCVPLLSKTNGADLSIVDSWDMYVVLAL